MIELPEPVDFSDVPSIGHVWGYTDDQLRTYGKACAAEAREQMRDECVKFCRENQVSRSPRGVRTFMPFDAECGGIHEGMDYAIALEKLK